MGILKHIIHFFKQKTPHQRDEYGVEKFIFSWGVLF